MNAYIKRGISSLPSVIWDPDNIDNKARTTAKEIKKECNYRVKEKEREIARKKQWESKFSKKKGKDDDTNEDNDDDDDEEAIVDDAEDDEIIEEEQESDDDLIEEEDVVEEDD